MSLAPRPARVVIVGGGLAALRAAEELRKRGHDGSLVILSAESHLPYDRPPLSKRVLLGETDAEATVFRSADFFHENDIEVRLNCRALSLDPDRDVVHTNAGDVDFDALIVATGATPRPLPGADGLAGVHTLRTIDDARAIRAAIAGGARVVVIGAGPIGAEVASSASHCGCPVTVVEAMPTPMLRAVGPAMGEICAELYGDHDVDLICGVSVSAVHGERSVGRVTLSSGRSIDADLVVVGIGAEPEVAWLEGSGVSLANGIVCDHTLATTRSGVYAAGDVACWPNALAGGRMRAEQWTNAIDQGRYVARSILSRPDAPAPFTTSNYFWSDQFGLRLQFVGWPLADEVAVVAGDVSSRKFLAHYRKGDRLVGAFALDMAKPLMQSKLLIERGASWTDAGQLAAAAA